MQYVLMRVFQHTSWFYCLSLFFLLSAQYAQAQTSNSQPESSEANPISIEAEQTNTVKAARDRLAEQIRNLQVELTSPLKRQTAERLLPVLTQLNEIYRLQTVALKNKEILAAEEKQYQEDISELNVSGNTESTSFLELVRTHEELSGLANRKLVLKAKLGQSQTLLAQAKNDLQDKRAPTDGVTSADSDTSDLQSPLTLNNAQLVLAQQTLRLREIQETNAKIALQAYAQQEQWLVKRIKLLERHAVFTEAELNNQLQSIEKDRFNLERRLLKARQQQNAAANSLVDAQRRLFNASPDHHDMLTYEVEAKRLADEAIKVQIELLQQRIRGLENRKTAWQQGYVVFNNLEKASNWLKWKKQATERLDGLEQDEHLISLWLDDWQKQLVTLDNALTDKNGAGVVRWIKQQHQSVSDIIATYQEQKIFLENSRRLQQKLIDLIINKTNHRNWREWLQLAWDYELYDNRLGYWATAAGLAIGLFSLLLFTRNYLVKSLQKHAEAGDSPIAAHFFASVRRTTTFFLLMISVFVSVFWLSLNPDSHANLKHLTMVALIFQVAVWMNYFFKTWMQSYLGAKARRDATSKSALSIFNFISQGVVWSIAFMLMLQNLGIDVTALATGLGIGGVAVALALQRILGDLFASLSIVLDKPFLAGDFVIFDQILGSVENIGIKTTRIRSLDGEQIICANSDLLNTRIRNFQRMRERRVVFQIGVVYETLAEQLAQIPLMLQDIITAQEQVRFDRAHFKAYGDFALTFEVVYYVCSPDYNLYMDIQQAINLAIFQRFQAQGIGFAYPTQSIYLHSTASPQAEVTA
ncbi:MAG: mechanosensitive ion channel [Methylomonas sp.]|uniref:mechanosensitive ion channel domain-containing protein n=1 Tax=Methylomonas sp. TaxID=418 RepID=UPI0025E53166|nr:mechanosensitive ion channel domain-containing protein [Methylomonas sp.]MCK9607591.1 mechanosensitive ion channel [Methylomonas sp.]